MFGEKLPYDMESAVSSFVLDDSTSTKEVMQLSIGQGQTLMSPLHLNMITQAIANGGVVHKATVVDKVTSASGTVLSQTKPEDYRTVMSSEVAQKMQEFMREVVVNGTATKLSTRPYNAAGKTGTAEFSTNTSDSNVWFTGYAYDDSHPKVAVTIIMEKTAGSGGVWILISVTRPSRAKMTTRTMFMSSTIITETVCLIMTEPRHRTRTRAAARIPRRSILTRTATALWTQLT